MRGLERSEVLARVNLHFLELPDWLFRFSSLAGEIGVADCGRLQGSFGRHFECARVRISVGTLGSAIGDSRGVRDGLRAITKRFGARQNPRRTMRSEDTTKCSSNDSLFTCSDTAVPRKVRYCTERRRAQLCAGTGDRTWSADMGRQYIDTQSGGTSEAAQGKSGMHKLRV